MMDWGYIASLFVYGPFWSAAGTVVVLSILAWVLASLLGMLVALGRRTKQPWLRSILMIYVWFFRSLPLLVLLIFVYNAPSAVPSLRGLISNAFIAGLIALVISETAYISEIFRGGLISVAHGQAEAARALGVKGSLVQRAIVIPQAFRVSLPALGNELVTIVKLTSLVSAISLTELLLVGQRLYTQNFKVLDTLFAVAMFYVLLVSVFDLGMKALERRLDVRRRRVTVGLQPLPTGLVEVGTRERHPHSGEVMLHAEAVTKSFGSHQVLKGIQLDVHRGEVVAIIGPSGSGKTTFIRAMNGLEPIDGGQLLFEGEPIGYSVGPRGHTAPAARTLVEQRRRIGMVFQQFNLFPHKTAAENVSFAPVANGLWSPAEAKSKATEYLQRVGLGEHVSKYPHQLSGGQQQRVAIARALAMSPEVILFDEPTSALDPELVEEVLAVMKQLVNEGLTMVVVTHEMRFARQAADWVVFMDAGEIVEQGPTDEVFDRPQNDRARTFMERVHA